MKTTDDTMNPSVRNYNQLAFHLNYIIANRHEDPSLRRILSHK